MWVGHRAGHLVWGWERHGQMGWGDPQDLGAVTQWECGRAIIRSLQALGFTPLSSAYSDEASSFDPT